MSNSTGFAPLPAADKVSFPSPPVPQEEKVPKSPSGGPIRARSLLKDDDGRDEEYRIKLSVKCRNIPRKSAFSKRNYIVCAFGIDPETKETAYFDQTEQVKDDESPAFLKNVWVRYFPGRSDQQFRFHVYQKDADKKKLGAADCLGAAIVKLNEVYRDPGVEFHFALTSAKPASEKLLRAKKSAIVLRLEDKERIVRGESEKSDSQIDADPVMRETSGPEVLRAVEAMMSYGRPFVCHKEDSAPQEQCVFYRKHPGTIGLLYWCDPSCRDEDQNSYIVLDAITDIYVGKHFKCFPSRLADDRCFSLVARKQRVEIPTLRASIASGLVEETKEKTALPTPPMVMLQLGDAKSVRIDLEARTLKQRDSWACGLLAFLNRKQIQVNVHESVKGGATSSSSDHKQSGERVLVV